MIDSSKVAASHTWLEKLIEQFFHMGWNCTFDFE